MGREAEHFSGHTVETLPDTALNGHISSSGSEYLHPENSKKKL